MTDRALLGLLATAALAACSPEEDEGGPADAGCTTADCQRRCVEAGRSGGTCVGGLCSCGEGDGGTDQADGGDAADEADGPPVTPCDVDILFVYDTSGSMMDAVGPLADEAFPAFAAALERYPHLGSVRVAVTTNLFGEHAFASGGSGLSCEGGVDETVETSLFLTDGWDPGVPHDALCCEEIPPVDCAFASRERWIEGPSPTMLDEFACAANVPCQQDVLAGEPTLEAGVRALQHDGNYGFLRDGAVLLAVFVTDEDDQSRLTPATVRNGLLALKGDDERYVAVVTIGGPRVGTVEVNPVTHAMGCEGTYGGTEETPRIIEFTGLFGARGVHFEMCGENDLSGALAAGFDILEPSCDEVILL